MNFRSQLAIAALILGVTVCDARLSGDKVSQNGRNLGWCSSCNHGNRPWYGWWFGWGKCQCDDGWEGPCCDIQQGFHEDEFALVRIKNDNIKNELVYADSNSNMPEELQGIFWMDQRGVSLPLAEDPSYKQVGPSAADELCVSFGEADWNPATRCAGPIPVYGGRHWQWFDQYGSLRNDNHSSTYNARLNLEFCFRNDEKTVADINMKIKASPVINSLTGWLLPDAVDGYIDVPRALMHLTIEKKSWGWTRRTTVGPQWFRGITSTALGSVLPQSLLNYLEGTAGDEFHYPLFRVIDGDGQETAHYQRYLDWANRVTDYPFGGFDHPLNRGEGKFSLIALPKN